MAEKSASVEKKDLTHLAGPKADPKDLAHAVAVLDILEKFRESKPDIWAGGGQARIKAIQDYEDSVRKKVAEGKLKPEVLDLYDLGDKEPEDWRE